MKEAYDLQNGLPWALGVIAFAVVTTWVYNHTQGSLLMPALFHTAINTVAFFFGIFAGGDLRRCWWLWGGLWVGAAVMVILATGSSLVRTAAQSEIVGEPVA